MIAARARYEASRSSVLAASKPSFNPELSLDADNGETQDRSVSLSQTIDWRNARETRTSIAEMQSAAEKATFIATQRSLASELVLGLIRYRIGIARRKLTDQGVKVMSDFAALAKQRFDQGDLNQVELSVASLAYFEARVADADAQVQVKKAIQQVAYIHPNVSRTQWPILESLQGLPAVQTESLAVQIPTVIAAQRRANAALATIELRKRETKSNPTLSLLAGKEGDEDLVGFGFSIPLYFRNNFTHEVDAATHEFKSAQQLADDELRRVFTQIETSSEIYLLYYSAWKEWEGTGLEDVDTQTAQLQDLWEAGELSTSEFLLQVQQTLDTRATAVSLKQDVFEAWLAWLSASGLIDQWLQLEVPQ
jgi:cobalt-zinc-cadmium efflux system outer membrane protein